MITTPAELKTYFAGLATALGCSFEYGNSERILNRQNSQLIYPVLWLEVPDIQTLRDGGLKLKFSTAITFLTNADADDYSGQDGALDAMFALTMQALRQIMADSDTYPTPFEFDMAEAISEYKQKWSADDDWGWRTEFTLTGAACEYAGCCED